MTPPQHSSKDIVGPKEPKTAFTTNPQSHCLAYKRESSIQFRRFLIPFYNRPTPEPCALQDVTRQQFPKWGVEYERCDLGQGKRRVIKCATPSTPVSYTTSSLSQSRPSKRNIVQMQKRGMMRHIGKKRMDSADIEISISKGNRDGQSD